MKVLEQAKKYEQYVIEMRRDFHKNPEVSGREVRTMKIVREQLSAFGIDHKTVQGGIVGSFKGKGPGKKIILRADMDALPMQEHPHNLKGPKSCVSQIDGVAHTCGHDGHTAMLLGAAKILTENQHLINGEVLFAFEQAEENGGGLMIVEHLRSLGADGVWGIHLKADIPADKISVDPGPRMASVIPFGVQITGKGGHGSRPDLAHSPLDCFTDFYRKLKDMRLNKLSPFYPTTLSVGHLEMGSTANIIPESLIFQGTIRHTSFEKVGVQAEKYFKEILDNTCKLHNCSYQYLREPKVNTLQVYNSEGCAEIAEQSVIKALGEGALYQAHPWMASESMALYMKYFPGVFAFLGIRNEIKGTGAGHHNPHFDIDEDVLKLGVAVTVQYALDFLNSEKPVKFTPEKGDVVSFLKKAGLAK